MTVLKETPQAIELEFGSGQKTKALMRTKIFFLNAKTLRVETKFVDPAGANRLVWRFRIHPSDRFFGMGERFNSAEHKGERVRVWSEEGGIGIGNLSKIFPYLPFNPFPHGPDTTYLPMPYFYDPAGYGFLLDDYHYSEFDFGRSNPKVLEITNWNNHFDFMIFYGASPWEVMENMTAYTGRIKMLPAWALSPWLDGTGGSERARQVADLARREKIPAGAVWLPDWWAEESQNCLNGEEWKISRKLYPDFEQLSRELHQKGFRVLGYFRPYLTKRPGASAFAEAIVKKYLIATANGEPYLEDICFSQKAQIDLTNPEAREWWEKSFFQTAVSYGMDGWMHDFGEHVPPDSIASDGSSGWQLHNQYPLLWARLGREFWDQERPDGDYVFFTRSGYTGIQKYAPLIWTGDSNSNWEKLDGLPSNIPAIISAGISGIPIATIDIAGFHCIFNRPADKELFIRWTELGALLPVMRNNIGNAPCHHWEFDSDNETLSIYKKFAALHTSLFPYLYTLVKEASEKGWPVVRLPAFYYPDDPELLKNEYQFFLGDRILVAPVLRKNTRNWKVYLPEGDWINFWNGQKYSGSRYVKVPAPLDQIPLFIQSGKIVPIYASQVDTLDKTSSPDLKGFNDANSSLKIIFLGAGKDEFMLWDGTKITCEKSGAGKGACSIQDAPIQRKYVFQFD
jgi:alpha-glucosidase (family GH31 glycosyl hydrolase)